MHQAPGRVIIRVLCTQVSQKTSLHSYRKGRVLQGDKCGLARVSTECSSRVLQACLLAAWEGPRHQTKDQAQARSLCLVAVDRTLASSSAAQNVNVHTNMPHVQNNGFSGWLYQSSRLVGHIPHDDWRVAGELLEVGRHARTHGSSVMRLKAAG